MFATAQPTSVPTAAPTAAPSPLELRPDDSQAIYVFYALMICFALTFVTILIMKLYIELRESALVSLCCVKLDACCCACFRERKPPMWYLARLDDTEVIYDDDFCTYLENDFNVSEPQPPQESTV